MTAWMERLDHPREFMLTTPTVPQALAELNRHFKACTNPRGACSYPRCDDARRGVEHFRVSCKPQSACSFCTLVRSDLIRGRTTISDTKLRNHRIMAENLLRNEQKLLHAQRAMTNAATPPDQRERAQRMHAEVSAAIKTLRQTFPENCREIMMEYERIKPRAGGGAAATNAAVRAPVAAGAAAAPAVAVAAAAAAAARGHLPAGAMTSGAGTGSGAVAGAGANGPQRTTTPAAVPPPPPPAPPPPPPDTIAGYPPSSVLAFSEESRAKEAFQLEGDVLAFVQPRTGVGARLSAGAATSSGAATATAAAAADLPDDDGVELLDLKQLPSISTDEEDWGTSGSVKRAKVEAIARELGVTLLNDRTAEYAARAAHEFAVEVLRDALALSARRQQRQRALDSSRSGVIDVDMDSEDDPSGALVVSDADLKAALSLKRNALRALAAPSCVVSSSSSSSS